MHNILFGEQMSLVQQFEYLMARRTCHKSYEKSKNRSSQPSNSLLNFNKIGHSIYQESFVQKINISPSKNNVEKFQELKKKLAGKASGRSRKVSEMTPVPTSRDITQGDDTTGSVDLIPYSLLCSKAIVHPDLRKQQASWKRGMRQPGQEQAKGKADEEARKNSFLKPKRRFSQDIQCNFSNTIFVGKHTRLKYPKKASEITDSPSSPTESLSPSHTYRIKHSPRKPASNKSSLTKDTKCSQRQFMLQRIDPWMSCVDDDQLEF